MVKKTEKPAEKTEKHEKKPAPAPVAKKPVREEKESFRGIVRIAGKDVKGQITLQRSLQAVRGIGQTMSRAASNVLQSELSIDPKTRVGDLTEEQIEKIDKILYSLHEYKIPHYLFNRSGDFSSGKDKHVIMNDLIFENSQDLDREKKSYSWKGYRHTYGQKVRGQRTRNTGRTGMAVGVLRKAIIAAQGGAVAGAKPGAPAAPAAAPAAGAKAPAAAAAKPAAKPAEKK
ncbi:MAG TPA: 30S ribosomal protein S13 [Candidatus Bilamarchaeum sp.]|nr:30S ribosomal protein S13 [Candidatus Bilamarchaeum sp.]